MIHDQQTPILEHLYSRQASQLGARANRGYWASCHAERCQLHAHQSSKCFSFYLVNMWYWTGEKMAIAVKFDFLMHSLSKMESSGMITSHQLNWSFTLTSYVHRKNPLLGTGFFPGNNVLSPPPFPSGAFPLKKDMKKLISISSTNKSAGLSKAPSFQRERWQQLSAGALQQQIRRTDWGSIWLHVELCLYLHECPVFCPSRGHRQISWPVCTSLAL